MIHKNKRGYLFIMMQYWSLEMQTEVLFSKLFLCYKVTQCSQIKLQIPLVGSEAATSVLHIFEDFHYGPHLGDPLWTNRSAAGAHKRCFWNTSSSLILLESNHYLSETTLWSKPEGIKWEWQGNLLQRWSHLNENAEGYIYSVVRKEKHPRTENRNHQCHCRFCIQTSRWMKVRFSSPITIHISVVLLGSSYEPGIIKWFSRQPAAHGHCIYGQPTPTRT